MKITLHLEDEAKLPRRVAVCGLTHPFVSPRVEKDEKQGQVAAELLVRKGADGENVFAPCPKCFDIPEAVK